MTAYYNEIDSYAAQWLRNLIAAGHIAPGDVDTRSIVDVRPDDLNGYTQCHFFAGIGGWSFAARLAGWPDNRALWTGSCPCQPFSVAGKGAGEADARHLWPEFFRLIAAQRPAVVMGEQVAAAVGKSWLDGVCADLEGIGYPTGAAVVPACAVDAPHRRDRLWFVADRHGEHDQRSGSTRSGRWHESTNNGTMANDGAGRRARPLGRQSEFERRTEIISASHSGDAMANGNNGKGLERRSAMLERRDERTPGPDGLADDTRASFWHPSELAIGADGKARRVKPGIRLLANGVPARVGKLRAFGNAIVPQVTAEIIGAYLDCAPTVLTPPPY